MSPEPEPAPSKKSHLHSLHNSHRHHHHSHSSRHRAKDVVQSAIPLHPPTSFGDLLRQARVKGSSSTTPSDSRRGSVQDAKLDEQTEAVIERRDRVKQREERKPVRPADVDQERRKAKAREEELRSSLQTLSDQSLKVSRRLDDTYYSILEKVSLWRQTIGSLQELASLTKELRENFELDAQGLSEDTKGQFEGFDNFDAQQEQVTALEARIKSGKERAAALQARLEAAQKRIEARAKVDEELEARKIRRARIIWGTFGTIIGLILLAILFQQLKPVHPDLEPNVGLDFSFRAKLLDAPIPDIAKEAIMSPATPNIRIQTPPVKPTTKLEDDHRLRIFDEL
ncbi:hypothetical protein K458DRAFT_341384 [Lentithecium fluviatile CBS 122367]|uniref:Uncharacterized protein n=1 Tax=Lentithecium fluviatile CBS 122367 TaxID=1168545 RepID=A0A6G1IWN6_9PLEO|nr:hypothetical protein K458DRAFT_341384 [Lentithecium fluviatile CBS 122367]